jgi:methylated-DNA-protein-cysteine methyltransferase related protein
MDRLVAFRGDFVWTKECAKRMPDKMREKIVAAIRRIPRGKVSTYGAVAKAAGFPGAARQVVAALRGAVGVPWQRVLGAGGAIKLRGDHAFEQRFRLEGEGVTFRGRRVDLKLHEHKFPKAKKKVL